LRYDAAFTHFDHSVAGTLAMNLLAEIIDHFASRRFGELRQKAEDLPVYLWGRSCQLNALLAAQAARVDAITEALIAASRERQAWHDPELYYPIFTLAETMADAARTESLLTRLEIQLGLESAGGLSRLPDALYRLAAVDGRTYRVHAGTLDPLPIEPRATIDGWPGLVYVPQPGLFADVLPAQYDRWTIVPPSGAAPVVARLSTALALLRRVAPDLVEDLADLITVIALMPDEEEAGKPDDSMRLRWSFNLRLRYFGGIFLNLYPVDVYGTVEGVVHEYYHQRLWQWWELDRPSGIPDPTAMIVSPVTGLQRQTIVMVQALLIYVGIHALYRLIDPATSADDSARPSWLRRRIAHITRQVPPLYESLRQSILPDTVIARVLDATMDSFYATRSAAGADAGASS
jgi:hypothetical protein